MKQLRNTAFVRNRRGAVSAYGTARAAIVHNRYMFRLQFRPDAALVRGAYLGYLTIVGGLLGWVLHRDPDTYRYIPASIRRYPGARGVVRLMETRGFCDVRYDPVLGGLMAIHHARKARTSG